MDQLHRDPFTIRGDFARYNAAAVSAAASHGYISTYLGGDTYSNRWLITESGLACLAAFRRARPDIFRGEP